MSEIKDRLYYAVLDATLSNCSFGIYTSKSEHIDECWGDYEPEYGLTDFINKDILKAAYELKKEGLIKMRQVKNKDVVELKALNPHEIAERKLKRT